ncbi:hypothetical protein Bca4012_036762 [Brassica carinata]
MEVNVIDVDDAEELLRSMFEQLEGLSLSEEAAVDETMKPWNINALLEPLPPQFRKKAHPPQQAPLSATAGVIRNLDQLMGPEYHPDTVAYTQYQSMIVVDPTQQLFSSNLNQSYIAATSKIINPTLQTGRSPSQALFTVPPESIHFTPVGSSVETCASADSDQQQPRKKQRR